MAYSIIYIEEVEGEISAEIVGITNHTVDTERFPSGEGFAVQTATDEADMKTKATAIQADWADNFDVRYVKKNA